MASVLVIYKEFPAPMVAHAGGQAVFRVIEFLHRQGHRVSLVTRVRTEEKALLDQVRPLCEQMYIVPHHSAIKGMRFIAFIRSYLQLRRIVWHALRQVQPDLVHVEVTQTAFAILGLSCPLTSFRPLDVNWFLLQQQAAQARGLRRRLLHAASAAMRRVERQVCRCYDLIAAISEGDRRLLISDCGSRPILIIPLSPSLPIEADVLPATAEQPPPGLNVLFVGAMYRSFNVQGVLWFLDHVWPRVIAQAPATRFYVVGYDPPAEILARRDGEHVFVVGFAKSLVPWYRAATVAISPLLVGGGLLQKVLDALAMGLPVVATSVSNHGVGATAGEHLLLADEPADFAAAVVHLLENPAECTRLGQAGQQFVRQQYNLEEALKRWEATWLDMLQHRNAISPRIEPTGR